jgi:hypothetical protein
MAQSPVVSSRKLKNRGRQHRVSPRKKANSVEGAVKRFETGLGKLHSLLVKMKKQEDRLRRELRN